MIQLLLSALCWIGLLVTQHLLQSIHNNNGSVFAFN